MHPRFATLFCVPALMLTACTLDAPSGAQAPIPAPAQTQMSAPVTAALAPAQATRNFQEAARRVEPVAEAECQARLPRGNCDFQILIDDRPDQPVNAYQTLNDAGRPLLVFTVPLIAEARNIDEIAFVMGHEAAHHIGGHIPQTQQRAQAGAVAGALLGALLGQGDQGLIDRGAQLGGFVGARQFSKTHELEADALGTVIAQRAGFDPVRGSAFFDRLPDPGDQFLGSHPPNADRQATVRRAAGL